MTDEPTPDGERGDLDEARLEDEPEFDESQLDDVDVRDLLRVALKVPEGDEAKLRRAVQDQIRRETQGRFFADGWSVSEAPRATFTVTTVLMLVALAIIYFLFSPRF
ncbi:MAG: hypothetical protein AAGA56_10995 [Myxococcota bacterium]